jgi:hypothetical protein
MQEFFMPAIYQNSSVTIRSLFYYNNQQIPKSNYFALLYPGWVNRYYELVSLQRSIYS